MSGNSASKSPSTSPSRIGPTFRSTSLVRCGLEKPLVPIALSVNFAIQAPIDATDDSVSIYTTIRMSIAEDLDDLRNKMGSLGDIERLCRERSKEQVHKADE
ncbi:MAG TPA: hypothetical protein VG713_13665 [Pirellulales bacterium]|nr:hypothetical protein [Pirellulales bacterium]